MVRVNESSRRARFANLQIAEKGESMAFNSTRFWLHCTIMRETTRTIGYYQLKDIPLKICLGYEVPNATQCSSPKAKFIFRKTRFHKIASGTK